MCRLVGDGKASKSKVVSTFKPFIKCFALSCVEAKRYWINCYYKQEHLKFNLSGQCFQKIAFLSVKGLHISVPVYNLTFIDKLNYFIVSCSKMLCYYSFTARKHFTL